MAVAQSPYDTLCDSLRTRGPTLNLLFEQARVALDRENDTVLRDAFAGTILLVLYDMLRGYWRVQGRSKSTWKDSGPKFAGYSLPQIVAAAVDNFRHFEDWDAQKPAAVAELRSVRILSAVLNLPTKKHGKRLPIRGNVSWAVLDSLAEGGGYSKIDALVRAYAEALVPAS